VLRLQRSPWQIIREDNLKLTSKLMFACLFVCLFVCLMVFNATFNNISITVISWRSVLLVEETRGPRKNQRPVASPPQTLSHTVVHFYFNHEIITGNFVVSTWCIDDMFSGDRTKFGDFSGHLLFVKFYSFVHFQ
jgi:hypothetical protein